MCRILLQALKDLNPLLPALKLEAVGWKCLHNWDYVGVSNRMQSQVWRLTISFNHIFSSPESSRRGWLTVHVTSELSNTGFNTSNAALNCLLTATLPFIGACILALAHSG